MNPTAELTADPDASHSPGLSQAAGIAHPRHWLGQGFWAVTDQALFAGTNFLLVLLLARWLSPEQFGAFAVAHTVFLLLSILYGSLLSEPLLVFGSSHFADRFPAYIRSLIIAHGLFSMLMAVVLGTLGIASWFLGSPDLAHSYLSFSVAGGLVLLLWMMRRACFSCLVPQFAALASLFYLLLVALGLLLMNSTGYVSVSCAVWLLGLSSLVCGLWLCHVLKVKTCAEPMNSAFRETIRMHWKYGRVAMVAQLLIFLPSQIYMLLLPMVYSLAEAGTFKAVMNFVTPLQSLNAAIFTVAIPMFVRTQDTPDFRKTMLSLIGVLAGVQLLAWSILSLFNKQLFLLAYDGRYSENSCLIYLIGSVPLLAGVTVILRASLKARERLDCVLRSAILAGGFSLLIGIPAMYLLGLSGIAIALVTFWALSLGFTGWLTRGTSERTPTPIDRV